MAKKQSTIENFEMFSYEAFCVYELLAKDPKNATAVFHGTESLQGFALPPDLYAPNGVPSLDIKGETVFEIKKNLSYSTLNDLQSYIDAHVALYNIVVVYYRSSLSRTPDNTVIDGKTVVYISIKDLKGSKRRMPKQSDEFYSDKVKKIDWKDERENIIARANKAAQLGNNVLFLGAGVSMSANMPSWNKLLEGLMSEVKQLKEPTLSAFKELGSHVLQECGDSYLIMARYLKSAIHQYDKKANFSELIQQYLYNKEHTSLLLDSLTTIIQQKKVNEVITYNFDDVLEQNLKLKGLVDTCDFTSISKDADIKGHNTLPIYHVHGIIPEVGATDTVVFSEEEYHRRYSNSYHWSNVEQLHALSRMHCFFVGLSMNDPNLRRLLDVAHEMNCPNEDPHFAFLKRTKLEDYCMPGVERGCKYVHVSKSLIDEKKQKDIYNLNYGVIENIFRELGVQVIWYEDHDELPDLLEKVFAMSKYKYKSKDDIIALCNLAITDIKNIEEGVPSFNPVNIGIQDMVKFLSYKSEHEKIYKELISDVKDMLNELSDRVEIEDIDTILKLKKQLPSYNESFSGFASFYSLWLECVKTCLK